MGERGWSFCFPESRCNQSTPPQTPNSPWPFPHATHRHTNKKHKHTKEQVHTKSYICRFHWGPLHQMRALNGEKIRTVEYCHRSLKWRHGTSSTARSCSYLHVQLCVWSLGPCACVWGVMRRGPTRRDKKKSDGGQAAASLAALTDLTHHSPPPPSGCPGLCLFAQGDK